MASGTELDGLGFLVDLANLFERAVARAFHDSPFEARPKQPIHTASAREPSMRYWCFQPAIWTTSARISSSRHTWAPRLFEFTSWSSTLRRRNYPAGMRPGAG